MFLIVAGVVCVACNVLCGDFVVGCWLAVFVVVVACVLYVDCWCCWWRWWLCGVLALIVGARCCCLFFGVVRCVLIVLCLLCC